MWRNYWMKGYMRCHSNLSLRKPKNTSLPRNVNFNVANLNISFVKLYTILYKHKFSNDRIRKVEESGITTVLKAPKIIAQAGSKTSRSNSTCWMQIIGHYIPPVYVYNWVFYKDSFLLGSPIYSVEFFFLSLIWLDEPRDFFWIS